MRQSILTLGIVGGTILGLVPATAQQPAVPAPFTASVVVTASLDEEPLHELPTSVTVITGKELQDRQLTSVADALGTVPGVMVARSGGPGNVTSVFLRGADSNHTLVLWNGMPLNDPLFGGYDFAYLAVDGAERIEVVRGPASALYGSEALAGVVQVITGHEDRIGLSLEGGDNAYRRAALNAGWSFGATHLDLAGHHRRGDGERPNDDFASDDLLLRGEVTLAPEVRLGLFVRGNDSEVGLPWSGGVLQRRQRSDWTERELALPFSWTTPAWGLEAQAGAYDSEGRYRNPDDPFFTHSESEGEMRRARAVAARRFIAGWLAAGVEWQRLEGATASDFGVAIDHDRQRNRAVFVDGHLSLGPWRVQAGARQDDNDNYGGHLSPRLGVVWTANEHLLVRASYGEAFRAPAIGELFYPGSGNPALDPEESSATEVAADLTLGAWHATAAVFDNRQHNLIDFDFTTFSNVNVGRARSRGGELAVGYRDRLVEVEANATQLTAEDRQTGQPLLRRPEESGNLLVRAYPGRLTLFGTLRYVGERPDVDPVTFGRITSPSYTRLDLGARFALRPWLAPYGRVENAADRSYAEVAGYPAPGRTFVGGVALSF